MTAQPLRSRTLTDDGPVAVEPKIPTVVLTAWKGGVWKTSIAVSLAERLALAGLRVGLLATDAQQDARARLGVQPTDPDVAHVQRGSGIVVAVGLSGPQAADVLYRTPRRLGPLDLAVVDTAPSRRGMRLPGTLVVVPVFDADSARNNVAALLAAPANCRIVLVKTGSKLSASDWSREVDVIARAVDRPMQYVPRTLRPHRAVAEAHAEGRSVWTLPRRGAVKSYLEGVDVLAEAAWRHAGGEGPIPDPPGSGSAEAFIPGWDDADDE
jgi:hypothetical protein